MFPYSANMPSGRTYTAFIITFDGLLQEVLPFSDLRLLTKYVFGSKYVFYVMGQLGISPRSTHSNVVLSTRSIYNILYRSRLFGIRDLFNSVFTFNSIYCVKWNIHSLLFNIREE